MRLRVIKEWMVRLVRRNPHLSGVLPLKCVSMNAVRTFLRVQRGRLNLLKEQVLFWFRKNLPWDHFTPCLMLLLSLIGIAFMYAVQQDGGGHKWKAQAVWLCLGGFVYCVTAKMPYHWFAVRAHVWYFLSILLLLLLWTPLGRCIGGSRRWLNLGITFQPSDVCKLTTLLLIAATLMRNRLKTFREALPTLGFVFLVGGGSFFLIFLQPDLGSAMVIPILVFGLLFVSRLTFRFFFGLLLLFIIGLTLLVCDTRGYYCRLRQQPSRLKPFLPLKDYQRNRILAFAVPTVIDPQGIKVGWHLKQSLIAVGSGGLFGKGWRHNTQARLGFLPKAASLDDFIFSVLAEETGLCGSCFVLALYALLVFADFGIALKARDRLGCYLCVGVGLLMMSHVWINVGMTLGLMPITGLPAPFLSYGGSFLLTCCFAQGLVQSVYRFRQTDGWARG